MYICVVEFMSYAQIDSLTAQQSCNESSPVQLTNQTASFGGPESPKTIGPGHCPKQEPTITHADIFQLQKHYHITPLISLFFYGMDLIFYSLIIKEYSFFQ